MPCALRRSAYGSALALGAQPTAVRPTTLSSLQSYARRQATAASTARENIRHRVQLVCCWGPEGSCSQHWVPR